MTNRKILAGATLAALMLSGPAFAAAVDATMTPPGQAALPAAPAGLSPTDQMLYEKGLAATTSAEQTPDAQRETAALNLLNNQGYGAPSDFRAEGNVFVATAERDGGTHTVVVDPDAGTVVQQ